LKRALQQLGIAWQDRSYNDQDNRNFKKYQWLWYVVHGRGCNPHRSLWRH